MQLIYINLSEAIMLQKLIAMLLNHPQIGPRLVDKLSDTYIIRRAARFTAYLYLRGKQVFQVSLLGCEVNNLSVFRLLKMELDMK